jgi:uncharacterized membrane protein
MIVLILLIPIPGVILLKYPLLFPYSWHKLLHVLGAILFVGNIIVTAAWMVMAVRTKDTAVIHFAVHAANWADVLFTGPGVILLIYNGMTLASRLGGIYQLGWITAGFSILGLSGIVWVGFLVRYQWRMFQLSRQAVESGGPLPEEFFKILRRWYFWGLAATLLPLAALFLMVTKPKLW